MATWSKNFTQIDNVNYGYEFELNDVPTTEMFNVPMNNTQYLYNLLNAGFLNSVSIQNNTITIGVKNATGSISYTTISISQLNGYTKNEIDTMVSNLNGTINSIGTRVTALEGKSVNRYKHHLRIRFTGYESGGSGNRFDCYFNFTLENNYGLSYSGRTFSNSDVEVYFDNLTITTPLTLNVLGMMRNMTSNENWKPILSFEVGTSSNRGFFIQYLGDVSIDLSQYHIFDYKGTTINIAIISDNVETFNTYNQGA